jgi:predicted metal-binding membrane protein
MAIERGSQQAFLGTSAVLFVGSVALTTISSGSMPSMGEMMMPGGWTMSMAWMRMPGQTWASAAAIFVGMWTAMMIAMMLPSLVPALWQYRETIGGSVEASRNRLTAIVAIGYFFVWTMCGLAVFPVGAALAEIEMQWASLARLVPLAVGIVTLAAGALQLTSWKRWHLSCCREPCRSSHTSPANTATAWRHGLRLGLHCTFGCAGFTAILLVIGVMDLRVMALVTAAITAERLAPNGKRIADIVGIAIVAIGLLLIARAAAGLA